MKTKAQKKPQSATHRGASASKRSPRARGMPAARQWSQQVTRTSDAMDLEAGVFTLRSAAAIARSLKHSVESSKRRKSPPFRSAMSMLTFEINRAGKGMPEARLRRLNAAKAELRKLFQREPAAKRPARQAPKGRKSPGSR